jgi:pyridoxine kinase
MNGTQLRTILEGLEQNHLLNDVGYVLTGYIGSTSFLEAVLDVLKAARQHNPNVKFVCDPVMGDHGKFYVPPELADVYRSTVIPKADVVTPNQFEVEQLTGLTVKTVVDAKLACETLHKMGPSIVFITSCILEDQDDDDEKVNKEETKFITIVASRRRRRRQHESLTDEDEDQQQSYDTWRIDCPLIPGRFTGTGDVTAALLLGHLANNPDNLPLVMEKVINTMYLLIQRTHEAKSDSVQSTELKLIQSKDIIENPPSTYKARRIS